MTSEKFLTIVLLDINDCVPILDYYPTPINVDENQPILDQLVEFHARDLDAVNTSNSLLSYSLIESNQSKLFHIDSKTGILTVKNQISFDFESQSSYSLILNISDHGDHPKRLEFLHPFVVHVNDLNDNAPKFEQNSYSFEVHENITIGTLIGRLKAIDADSNSTIFYELTCLDDQDVFEIGSTSGELRTKAFLDYETHPIHRLYITAKDNDHLHSTRVTVTIHLLDINDNIPIIDTPSAVYIPSELLHGNISKSILITTIIAHDRDSTNNANLTYTIIDGNQHEYFQLNRYNGTIIGQTKNLPQGHHRLTIKVCDRGEPNQKCTTTMVNIKVGELIDKIFYTTSYNYQQPIDKSTEEKEFFIDKEQIFTREMLLVVLISTILTLVFSITMGILIAFLCKHKRCRHVHRSSLKKPCQLIQSTDADKLLATNSLSSTTKVCSPSELCHLRDLAAFVLI